MKASELIKDLNKLILEHGDLNVTIKDWAEGKEKKKN